MDVRKMATLARWAATAVELQRAQGRMAERRMQAAVQAPLIELAELVAQPSLFDLAV